jgi:hypothetical protein
MPVKKKIVKEVAGSVKSILQDPITALASEHWIGKAVAEV